MSDQINLTEARQYLTKLTLQAGDILKKYFESGKFTSKSKGGVDVITQVDEEVDKFLRENIKTKYPNTSFLTEETAPRDYSSLKEAENLWVIDPLDGTVNFSRHHPYFAISIGLVDKGLCKLGVVYVPLEEDLYWAEENQEDAFLNGKPIRVSSTEDLKETVIGCDWGWVVDSRLITVEWLNKIVTHVRQIKSMGSAVADLANLAAGRIDVYIHSGLKPWDVAAASLLIEKAGGEITTPTGDRWDIFTTEIVATNTLLHEQILDLIKI